MRPMRRLHRCPCFRPHSSTRSSSALASASARAASMTSASRRSSSTKTGSATTAGRPMRSRRSTRPEHPRARRRCAGSSTRFEARVAGSGTTASLVSVGARTRRTCCTWPRSGVFARSRFITTTPGTLPSRPRTSRRSWQRLDVDLFTHVVDNTEADDIFRAFFTAGVAEIDASTDLALAETMYRAAWKHRVGFILEGHSFLTEGITPVGRNYFDGRYIQAIHARFGTRPMRTYPLMTFSRFLFWADWRQDPQDPAVLVRALYEGGGAGIPRARVRLEILRRPPPRESDDRVLPRDLPARRSSGRTCGTTASPLALEWARCRARPPGPSTTPRRTVEDDLLEYFKKRLGLTDAEYGSVMHAAAARVDRVPDVQAALRAPAARCSRSSPKRTSCR